LEWEGVSWGTLGDEILFLEEGKLGKMKNRGVVDWKQRRRKKVRQLK